MISRIRVDVRAASMEEAEREATLLLDHARTAGYLEGILELFTAGVDDHFGHAKNPDLPGQTDPWTELGLGYEGRMAVSFNPPPTRREIPKGGLKQYQYEALQIPMADPPGSRTPDEDGEGGFIFKSPVTDPAKLAQCINVTDKAMVLERQNKVTREHGWETDPSEATAEEILDLIRSVPHVSQVRVAPYECWVTMEDGEKVYTTELMTPNVDKMRGYWQENGWRVALEFNDGGSGGSFYGETLREAALQAWGACGRSISVTNYSFNSGNGYTGTANGVTATIKTNVVPEITDEKARELRDDWKREYGKES